MTGPAPQFGENPWSEQTPTPKPMRYFSAGPGNVLKWVAATGYDATAIKIAADGPCAGRLVVSHKTTGGTVWSKTEVVDFVWAGVGAAGAGEPCMLVKDLVGGDSNPNGCVTGDVAGQKSTAFSTECVDLVANVSGSNLSIYQGAAADDSLYIKNDLTAGADADELHVAIYLWGVGTEEIQAGIET